MTACMYNITADPCEYVNIIDMEEMEEIREEAIDRLKFYYTNAVPPKWPLPDPTSLPPLHNFTWVPWTDDVTMWN